MDKRSWRAPKRGMEEVSLFWLLRERLRRKRRSWWRICRSSELKSAKTWVARSLALSVMIDRTVCSCAINCATTFFSSALMKFIVWTEKLRALTLGLVGEVGCPRKVLRNPIWFEICSVRFWLRTRACMKFLPRSVRLSPSACSSARRARPSSPINFSCLMLVFPRPMVVLIDGSIPLFYER